MGKRPPRPCRYPGCGEVTADGWCPAHRPRRAKRGASAQWHKFYLTRLWRDTLRPGQLLREPFCRACAGRGLRMPATEVDHIRPHKGDWNRFADPDNLQSLCHSCHSRKTMAENRGNPGGF